MIVGRLISIQRWSRSSVRSSAATRPDDRLVVGRVEELEDLPFDVDDLGIQIVVPKQRVIRSAMLVLPLPG